MFGGFRATVNFGGPVKEKKEDASPVSGGVYRAYKEEFYGNGSLPDPPKKITPSMVKLPGIKETNAAPAVPKPPPISAQSVPNLTQVGTSTPPIAKEQSKSTTNIAKTPAPTNKVNVSAKDAKNQEKELKKLEKQRQAEQKKQLAEQKKREAEQKKLEKKRIADAAKEAKLQAAREAKLKKEREKDLKIQNKKNGKKPTNKTIVAAPPPPPAPKAPGIPEVKITNPLAKTANPLAQKPAQSTDTLKSSISKTSGPPPYSDKETVPNKSDNSGNTSFVKPTEEGSWDFISQHRQQMSRPATINPTPRNKGNLEYSVGNAPKLVEGGNSEA